MCPSSNQPQWPSSPNRCLAMALLFFMGSHVVSLQTSLSNNKRGANSINKHQSHSKFCSDPPCLKRDLKYKKETNSSGTCIALLFLVKACYQRNKKAIKQASDLKISISCIKFHTKKLGCAGLVPSIFCIAHAFIPRATLWRLPIRL